jgi:hypothetical protein
MVKSPCHGQHSDFSKISIIELYDDVHYREVHFQQKMSIIQRFNSSKKRFVGSRSVHYGRFYCINSLGTGLSPTSHSIHSYLVLVLFWYTNDELIRNPTYMYVVHPQGVNGLDPIGFIQTIDKHITDSVTPILNFIERFRIV